MRVIITGGTGLIGKPLAETLACRGYEVVVMSRDPTRAARVFERSGAAHIHTVGWDGHSAGGWGELIGVETAIVNLAGASPAHWRWTPAYKERILQSRLHAGAAVMQAIAHYGPPAVLVQASASGYYGDRGQEMLTETSPAGSGFRAEVCQAWEASTAGDASRRCVVRTGIVLDTSAGAFPPLLRFARLQGKRLGSGQQWVPWILNADVAQAIQVLIECRELCGPFNLCAPNPVTHEQLMRTVHRELGRPAIVTVPTWWLHAALGGLASVVLDSQRMLPQCLLAAGFRFEYPHLDGALHYLFDGACR